MDFDPRIRETISEAEPATRVGFCRSPAMLRLYSAGLSLCDKSANAKVDAARRYAYAEFAAFQGATD